MSLCVKMTDISSIYQLNCKVISLWISFKFKSVYVDTVTLRHLIKDNKLIEDIDNRVKLVFKFTELSSLKPLIDQIETLSKNVTFNIDPESVKSCKKDGYSYHQYNIKSVEDAYGQ